MSVGTSVCMSEGPRAESSDKNFMSPRKSSLFSGLVPWSGVRKYLQGGVEKEKMGGLIDEVERGRIIGLIG